MWIVWLSVVLALYYSSKIFGYLYYWNLQFREESIRKKDHHAEELRLSVIVPFRNEKENLSRVISALENQTFENCEFILVDDHSEDESLRIAQQLCDDKKRFCVTSLPSERWGKKEALQHGISLSSGNIIVTTDADCTMEPGWLEAHASFYLNKQVVMLSGPVVLEGNGGFFSRWQELEFQGLNAIGAACIQADNPTMCNGANLSYRKKVFYEVQGFEDNKHILSGDDEFLMHKIHSHYPGQIGYLNDRNAFVFTRPSPDIRSFLQQRLRWTSKTGFYRKKAITVQLILSYMFIVHIPLFLLLGFWWPFLWPAVMVLFLLKSISEVIFFKTILPFYGKKELLRIFLPAQAIHIAYVTVIGVLGTFVKFSWKGRAQ